MQSFNSYYFDLFCLVPDQLLVQNTLLDIDLYPTFTPIKIIWAQLITLDDHIKMLSLTEK